MTFLIYSDLQQTCNRSWVFSKLFRSSLKNPGAFPSLPWWGMMPGNLGNSRRDLCAARQRDPGGSAPPAAWDPLADFPVRRLSFPISLYKQKTRKSFPDSHYHFSLPSTKNSLNSNSVTNSLNMKSLLVVQNTFKAFILEMHLVTLIMFHCIFYSGRTALH